MAVYSLNHNAMFLLATQPQLGFRVQGSFLAMDSLCAFPSTNIFVLTACGPRGWSHPPLPRSLSIIGLNRYQRQKGGDEIGDGCGGCVGEVSFSFFFCVSSAAAASSSLAPDQLADSTFFTFTSSGQVRFATSSARVRLLDSNHRFRFILNLLSHK